MRICTKCGCQYPDGEVYCGICGNPLVRIRPVSMGAPQVNQPSAYQIKPLPAKKRLPWKIWIGAIEILFGVFLLICFGMVPYEMKMGKLNTMPEQTAQVEVVKTVRNHNKGSDSYFIYCKFPDDTEKTFSVEREYFNIIAEGEKGTLFYKERSNKKGVDNRLFIRFEKD